MSRNRKQYNLEFKSKVVTAAIKNEETIAELAAKNQVHPTMVNNWKKALLEGASDLYDKGHKSKKNQDARRISCAEILCSWRWKTFFCPKGSISEF